MDTILFSLVTVLTQWLRPRYNARLRLLEAQTRMLRARIDTSRIVPTPQERAELLRLGAEIDHDIDELMHVVVPAIYKKWLRQLRGGQSFKPSGRPRTPLATRKLVLRMAKDNLTWGCRRIVGEIKKLVPGAGKRLAPVLAAITAPVASGRVEIEAIRCVSGVAPVEDQSGKRHRVGIRRRCNKHWRDVMHLFAYSSTHWCSWAKAFYDTHREQGDHHASALRKLADKWLKIINRMLETGEPYDDQQYVEALRRNGSPLYLRLAEKTCG